MAKLKVGIVGGRRGGSFFQVFKHMPETEVFAVCDLRPEVLQTARADGIPHADADFDRFLERGPDIVVVATPPDTHVRLVVRALAAGKHVISEVPAAHTLAECYELKEAVEAAERRGQKYALAENLRFLRPAETVKRLAEAGLFGEIYNAVAEYLHESRHLTLYPDGTPSWRASYPLIQYTTHNLGPVLWIMGDRVVTASAMDTGPSHYEAVIQRSDVAAALFQTERGGLIQFRIDGHSPRPHNLPYFAIQGTKGAYEGPRGLGDAPKVYIEGESPPGEWEPLARYEERVLGPEWNNLPDWATAGGHGTTEYFMLGGFVRSILDDTAPPVGVDDALNWTVPGIIALASIRAGGAPLEVPRFGPHRHSEPDRHSELVEESPGA